MLQFKMLSSSEKSDQPIICNDAQHIPVKIDENITKYIFEFFIFFAFKGLEMNLYLLKVRYEIFY